MNPASTHERALLALAVLVWCAALSTALVPVARALAERFGVLDWPGERKVHAVPTPRLGGVAVFGAFTWTVLFGYLAIPWLGRLAEGWPGFEGAVALLSHAHLVADKLSAVILGCTLAFLVGLADDVLGRRFPVGAKAAGQVVAASVLVLADVRVSVMPWEWLNVAITLLWVVGIANSFNFLDNMDGLSAGVAACAAVILFVNAWSRGEFFIGLIVAAFLGSLLGFLRHNFHPATVFLGDCGSLFIGYAMASLTLLERYVSHASSSLFPVLMPVLVLAIPLLDTVTVIVIRLREHRPVYVGDKRHLSHRLVSLGFSTRQAVLSIYLAAFCFGLGAALLPDATRGQSLLVLLQAAGFATLLLVLMFHVRAAPDAPAR